MKDLYHNAKQILQFLHSRHAQLLALQFDKFTVLHQSWFTPVHPHTSTLYLHLFFGNCFFSQHINIYHLNVYNNANHVVADLVIFS